MIWRNKSGVENPRRCGGWGGGAEGGLGGIGGGIRTKEGRGARGRKERVCGEDGEREGGGDGELVVSILWWRLQIALVNRLFFPSHNPLGADCIADPLH